jgi:hypothetical protein
MIDKSNIQKIKELIDIELQNNMNLCGKNDYNFGLLGKMANDTYLLIQSLNRPEKHDKVIKSMNLGVK